MLVRVQNPPLEKVYQNILQQNKCVDLIQKKASFIFLLLCKQYSRYILRYTNFSLRELNDSH